MEELDQFKVCLEAMTPSYKNFMFFVLVLPQLGPFLLYAALSLLLLPGVDLCIPGIFSFLLSYKRNSAVCLGTIYDQYSCPDLPEK